VAQTGIERFFDYDLVKLTVNEKIRRIGNSGMVEQVLTSVLLFNATGLEIGPVIEEDATCDDLTDAG
jgi:hypothetical protein